MSRNVTGSAVWPEYGHQWEDNIRIQVPTHRKEKVFIKDKYPYRIFPDWGAAFEWIKSENGNPRGKLEMTNEVMMDSRVDPRVAYIPDEERKEWVDVPLTADEQWRERVRLTQEALEPRRIAAANRREERVAQKRKAEQEAIRLLQPVKRFKAQPPTNVFLERLRSLAPAQEPPREPDTTPHDRRWASPQAEQGPEDRAIVPVEPEAKKYNWGHVPPATANSFLERLKNKKVR